MAEHKHRMLNRRQVLTGAATLGGFAAMLSFVSVKARGDGIASCGIDWDRWNEWEGRLFSLQSKMLDDTWIDHTRMQSQ